MAEGKKRNRAPVIKRDPLIEAVIRKLPSEGATWPVEQRQAWLRMAVQAFDVAYGVQPEIHIGLEPGVERLVRENPVLVAGPAGGGVSDSSNVAHLPARRVTAAEVAALDEQRYFIDADGFARGPGGKPIKATEVPREAVIEDERPAGQQDLDSIMWADGQWPANALPSLNVVAA
ncbi:MAG: hypothetical protein V4673_14510 [Pseudomonadota bacterium]